MPQNVRDDLPNIFPAFRYQDAPAALAWLAATCQTATRWPTPRRLP